jgi:16S rRNA (guanine966-N2)-methyltransferase
MIDAPRRGEAEVRPTTERTREAIFSILGPLDGLRVLDLFAGTGALALEAISRGAEEAVMVDLRPELARRNAHSLDLEDRATAVRSDALRYLSRAPEDSFDLVLCDPPYGLDPHTAQQLGPALARALAPGGRLMVESSPKAPIEVELPIRTERRYGDTLVRIHASEEGEG